jgi:hypothetical protein
MECSKAARAYKNHLNGDNGEPQSIEAKFHKILYIQLLVAVLFEVYKTFIFN